VILSVFDLNGNNTSILTEGIRQAGQHTQKWNTIGMSPGIYIVRIIANGYMDAHKVSLLQGR